MLFSSMVFIWVFLPIAITINYLFNLFIKNKKTRMRVKNVFLLVMSLIFYAWGGIHLLPIMLTSIVINYIFGILIDGLSAEKKIRRGILLFFDVIINLLILIYYKYFNMIIAVVEQLLPTNPDKLDIFGNILLMKRTYELPFVYVALPIGISFFTFQAMSYVIDVYRKKAPVQKNILNFGLYVSLFPQLIAGPIVRYEDVAYEINNRVESLTLFTYGIKRFCYGLAKKVLIANTMAVIVDNVWALELSKLGLPLALFTAICYTFQIYYDFSGYSDMAIGLGKIFGFNFRENFNYPYISLSVIEFWRRWHISLSTWFKEYVYIPLGGNRHGLFRTCLNVFIVFFLTGIWHGANFTFIIWGVSYGIIEIFERLCFSKVLENSKYKIFNAIYTFAVVLLLFIIFRADKLADAVIFYKQLFSFKSSYSIFTYLSMKNVITIIIAALCAGFIQTKFKRLYDRCKENVFVKIIDFALQIILLVISIAYIVSGTYNPFIYFQF